MNESEQTSKLWLNCIEPLPGESISHFLGRFRRAKGNRFSTPSSLGRVAGLGAYLVRWEKFYLNPFPTHQELEALADVVGLEVERLSLMFPPPDIAVEPQPIRLCGYCYQESPCHRIEWQFRRLKACDRHQKSLLSQCPRCCVRFPSPALWIEGACTNCSMAFEDMAKYQKRYRC